jgi:SAM-dependent methyltransferase
MYCRIRFQILRQRFLDEIGQYLPHNGIVWDIGCGFGLFSLYFAATRPHCQFYGFDLNPRRIEIARRAALSLKITNVHFEVGDARNFKPETAIAAAYMLDIIHHIPRTSAKPLLGALINALDQRGSLIVKDVDDRPFWKCWFTLILDKLMDPSAKINYWSCKDLQKLFIDLGCSSYTHQMVDYLPYPHRIYIVRKTDPS